MAEQRRGDVHYAVASSEIPHGSPVADDGFAGVAVKQGIAAAGIGLGSSTIYTIQSGETYVIRLKGLVLVPQKPAPWEQLAVGDAVYVDNVDWTVRNTLGRNEQQTIVVKATGGTFTITYSGQTTAAINYNATAAAVRDAMELLSNIADDGSDLMVTGGEAEVQHVEFTATGGTFRLGYDGEWTGDLAYNISTANLQTALTDLSNIGAADVVVGGSAGAYTVTFTGDLRNQDVPLLEIDEAKLTGLSAGPVIQEATKGSAYLFEFTGTKADADQPEMTTNSGSLTGASHTATPATVVGGRATTTGVKFGRVEGIAGDRGVPTGYVRVNLDARKTF